MTNTKPHRHAWRRVSVLLGVLLLAGCASTRMVPFTVQSDPLGAHVLYQVQSAVKGSVGTTDWIYLGVTPVDVRREVGRTQLRKADSFVLRVVKEGYFDQQKAWTGKDLAEQIESKGRVFWNPRMVASGQ